jgi:hypothetical protein
MAALAAGIPYADLASTLGALRQQHTAKVSEEHKPEPVAKAAPVAKAKATPVANGKADALPDSSPMN